MVCEICTMDTLRGTMYRLRLRKRKNCNVCSTCRDAAIAAERMEVDEVTQRDKYLESLKKEIR